MVKILVLNGPNINRLGLRNPAIYGSTSFSEAMRTLSERAVDLDVQLAMFQSNSEGSIIDFVQEHMDAAGILVNPAGLTIGGRALIDSIMDVEAPVACVHLSAIYRRGYFSDGGDDLFWRKASDIVICGLGVYGYVVALEGLVRLHQRSLAAGTTS